MVALGAVKYNFWVGFAAATSLVLGAAYTLWMIKRVVFGAVVNKQVAALLDLETREYVILGLLAVCVLGMGLYPHPFVEVLHPSVEKLLKHIALSKI